MTIPVKKKGRGLQRINDVKICRDDRWGKKHARSISSAYSKAPYYKDHRPFVETLFASNFESLIDLNMEIIHYIMKQLRIRTPVMRLSQLSIESKGSRMLVDVCKTMKASTLLIQTAAAKYLDATWFKENGILLKTFKPPQLIYPQLWGDFIPNLSTLDLMLNCGPKAHDIMAAK